MVRRWVGGGGRAAYDLRLHRRPSGPNTGWPWGRRPDLRAYAREPARGVKSGGWGAKAAVVVVAVVVVVGDGVVGGVAVIVSAVARVNIHDKLGQHSPR